MTLSVCTDAVFRGIGTPEAIRRTASLGYKAVEFWAWWDRDMDAVVAEAGRCHVAISAMCTRMVPLTDPAQRGAYLAGLAESVAMAQKCGTPILISQVGNDTGAPRTEQHASIVAGLKAAAPLLEGTGTTLAIEPLNVLYDHKGYYLSSSAEAFAIIDAVGNPRIKATYDIYHQQVTEGNITNTLCANLSRIAHIHVAGVPGRHEPGRGELDNGFIFTVLRDAGYNGCIGLEYFPVDDPETGLKEFKTGVANVLTRAT